MDGIQAFDQRRLKKVEKVDKKETVVPQNKMAAQLMAVLNERRNSVTGKGRSFDEDDEEDEDW
ncbi:hypothetical protein AGMMS49949_06030 [Alphaproteobacteria bacterium]|nr:hypothetical protein AGMMS49949_06030 [Alphaproteobacteria bacterium]GHS97586.1 hypothetical protein AGMMS50296_4680 [Alphaproteobacteria bacterium]